MTNDEVRREGSCFRRLVFALVALVALVGVALVVMTTRGQSKVEAEVAAWAADGRDLDEFLQERPKRVEPNASALELERLAGAVGISVVPKSSAREQPPGTERAPGVTEEWQPGQPVATRTAVRDAGDWMQETLARPAAAIPEPPPTVPAWFAQQAAAWEAVKRHLVTADPPLWEQDLGAGFEAPIPNLLGAIQLARLLLADALLAGREGRVADAERALDASWKLTEGLEQRDTLISHLILVAIAKMQAGVVRHVPGIDANEWSERLMARHLHARLARALTGEAVTTLASHRGGSLGSGADSAFERLGMEILGPGAVAHVLGRYRAACEAIDDSADCAAVDAARRADAVEAPGWNPIARMIGVDPSGAVTRSALADFQAELTAKVLEARAADGSVGDEWRASRCEDLAYEIAPTDSGGFSVSFASELPKKLQDGAGTAARRSAASLSHVEP